MAGFPQWLTRAFYFVGVSDRPKFRAAYDQLLSALSPTNAFSGDNLITWGRQLSFATDPKFFSAFMAAKPDDQEIALAWRLHILYWAARRGLELEGDFVEAACFKGFTARVLCNATDFGSLPRTYWLYDRFSAEKDGLFLKGHHEALHDAVVERFSDCPNVRVIKGNIPEVLAEASPERISFLHLDMNNAAAEIGALDVLYDRLSPGGFIVLDDYGWMGNYHTQKPAHDAWFTRRGKMVAELPTGQGLVIK